MRIPKNKPIIGYKAFTKALQCREYQFEIGKEYHHKGPIQLCAQGFHFCSSVAEVFDFAQYDLSPQTTRVCSVLAWGNVQEDTRSGRYVASNIRIIRELSLQQVLSAANLGAAIMAGAIAVHSITAAIIQAVKTLATGISGQVITAEIIMAALIGAAVTMATVI